MAYYSVDLLSRLHVAGPLYSDGGVPSFSSVVPGIYLKPPRTFPAQIDPDLSCAVISPQVVVEFWTRRLGHVPFPATLNKVLE
jgi:hypothetical protein